MKRTSTEIFAENNPRASIQPIIDNDNVISSRNKLGNLLKEIRNEDVKTFEVKNIGINQNSDRRGRGRAKFAKVENKVTNEVRDKTFTVRDNHVTEPIYPLLRKWMYGYDLPPETAGLEISSDDTSLLGLSSMNSSEDKIDLLVTKEIHKMPEPLSSIEVTLPVMKIFSTITNPLPYGSSVHDLLKENKAAWKNCKEQHKKYMQIRDSKFEPSINLLKTIYDITKQSNQ